MPYFVYFLTNQTKSVLYIGLTSNLQQRIEQHRSGSVDGFTKRYNVKYLIYYEVFESLEEAKLREKRLKAWKREWKENLIKASNPDWKEVMIEE